MTWQEWMEWASSQLYTSASPKLDVEIILKKIVGKSSAHLRAFNETSLNNKQLIDLAKLLFRRINGEPMAYIIGTKEFWSLNLKVSIDTLIPRPDTEHLVELALHLLPRYQNKILDLGTGTGAIALALAHERAKWKITGVDFKKQAVILAQNNAAMLNLNNTLFIHGNWFNTLQGMRYNLIISNPPYISVHDPCLTYGDIRFEPKSSLISKNNGLKDLTIICQSSSKYLKSKGWIILEHGWKQGKFVRDILFKSGFSKISTICDYGSNERVTYGQWLKNINCLKKIKKAKIV